MRHVPVYSLVAAMCLGLCGCDEKAIDFANKTRDMLAGYQKQLQRQIAEAEKHYLEYATLQADSTFTRRKFDLAAVRSGIGERLAFAYADKSKQPSHIREELSVYAEKEHEIDLAAHQGEVDRSRAYLEKIEELRIDKDKIEAFGKLLDGMAVKKPLQKDAEEIKKFVEATKGEFDSQVCKDLEGQIKALKDKGKDETAAEKAKQKTLEDLFATRKCSPTS